MPSTSVRLPDDLLDALDRMAEREQVDRSTMIRRSIEEGLEEIAIREAIRRYDEGGITAWSAARDAGIPLLAFVHELERRDKWFRTDEETLKEQLDQLEDGASG